MSAAPSGYGRDHSILLHDGRTLGYAEYGSLSGRALFYFHGHPGSRLEAAFLARQAAEASVRLIGVDRPGMGLSGAKAHRRFLDWPGDVTELADALGIDAFAVAGFSGGGPYAAACAYAIPDRLTACGLIAGVGPTGPFLSFLSGCLPWLLTPIIGLSMQDENKASKSLAKFAQNWVAPDRESFLRPEISRLMTASLVEAFRQGARGPAYEGTLFGRPSGFQLEDITRPIPMWYGGLDREVPVSMAQTLSRRIAHCDANFYPDEGHISLIANHAQEIVAALTA